MKYNADGYQELVEIEDAKFTMLMQKSMNPLEWESLPEFEDFVQARDNASNYYKLWMWLNKSRGHCG